MTLLNFHSYQPVSCKEGIISSQALWYNMIISEDCILQEELNVIRILLARAYPPHLIIKSKKALIYIGSNLLSQRLSHKETNIHPIITPFSDISKSFTTSIHKNWHPIASDTTLSTIWQSKPLFVYKNSISIHNHLVHSAHTYGSSQHNSKLSYIHTPTYSLTRKHTYRSYTILSPPNNSTQWILVMLATWWNSATCYKDQHITQRQCDIPTRSLSCWFCQNFSLRF